MKKITKRICLGLALAFMAASPLFAAKARPATVSLTLTDGCVVSAQLVGDEYLHYYQMLDGTPLKKTADGKYEATTYEAITGGQAAYARSRASDIGSSTPSYFPHTGSPKALVILVQFQDVKFKSASPYNTFNHYLNAKKGESMPEADKDVFITDEEPCQNYGSVSQYFADMSNNQFSPQFDIVGPVTVSKNSSYYGKNGSGNDNNDQHYTDMIKEACQLVDDRVNFADYDSDNDGYVDLVYIIYAGYSESISGNSEDCLWPKSGTADKLGTYDGKTVCRFGINNELNETPEYTANRKDGKLYINGIGLFCHEFSHCLGIPDLYPTTKPASTQNNQSPEYWDVMDMGCYGGNGYYPIPYSPWEKSIMGWVQPTTLSAQAQQITLEPYNLASKALKIEADDKSGEYLLLQNIRQEGWYQYVFGYGLLVWRIDYADLEHVNLFDYPNNRAGKPRVMIVPADALVINSANTDDGKEYSTNDYGISLMNDPFPAYASNRTDGGGDVDSLVEVKLNNSTLTTRPLYNIKKDEATGMVTFDYLKNYVTAISPAIVADEDNTPTEYYDLEGRRIDSPRRGQLYITGKGEKIIYQ